MTAKPDPIQERASREATEWLILLQEEPDDPDLLRRFEAWLQKGPVNAAAWSETLHASKVIAALPPAYAERWRAFAEGVQAEGTEGSGEKPAPSTTALSQARSQSGRTGRRRAWMASGLRIAALAVAASLALLLMPDVLLHLQADHTTKVAETRRIPLEDGSAIVLAPSSAIAVAYSDRERRVDLLAGQAFFEVASQPNRPFRVDSRQIQTTAIGTGFDVRDSDDGTTVSVQEGIVRVDNKPSIPAVSEALAAGEVLRVARSGRVERGRKPPAQVAAWRRGQLVVVDQPFQDVVDRLRPYHSGTIVLADRSLAERSVTGVYNLAAPLDALRAVAHAHDATVHQITPWILVVSGSQARKSAR